MDRDMREVARRHHTVPKFYLNGFAKAGQVTTVQLPGRRRFPQSVTKATVAKDFYSVDAHEEGEDVVERALAEIEGATAAVVKKMEAGTWPLSYEDRMAIGYYISLQAMRVPVQRRTMDYLAKQLLRLQIGAGGKSGLRRQMQDSFTDVSDETVDLLWEQATRPEGPPIQRPKTAHIQQMLELADELVPYVVGRPWLQIRFQRRSLITSDAPIGLVPDPEEEVWRGTGFMTAWGITFPVTRKMGLLLSSPQPLIDLGVPVEEVHRGAADRAEGETTYLEKFLNSHTAANASEWIYHHPDDARFVPEDLPDPRPVNMKASSEDREFDGRPWFGGSVEGQGGPAGSSPASP